MTIRLSCANRNHGRKTVANGVIKGFNACLTSSAFIQLLYHLPLDWLMGRRLSWAW